jgi:hypothetical protein
MTSTILVVPQAMGGVPGALGTSQHPPSVSARAPSTPTALPARSGLRFPSPYRGDLENPFLASNISTEVCFVIYFFTFLFLSLFFRNRINPLQALLRPFISLAFLMQMSLGLKNLKFNQIQLLLLKHLVISSSMLKEML